MTKSNEIIVSNYFIFGDDENGIYSDIKVKAKINHKVQIEIVENIEFNDKEVIKDIISEFENCFFSNSEKIKIIIIHIGNDNFGRKYKVTNSVRNVMFEVYSRLDLKMPNMFEY